MVYKKKLMLLSGLVGILALAYLLSLFFDPERVSSRSAAFLWLDPKLQNQADGIEIARAGNWENPLSLARRGDDWFVFLEGAEFPAKKSRVEDLLRLLSTRGAYPVRGAAVSSHERLGLTPDAGARILVKGGAGLPLLDLLVGSLDAAGNEVYLRKNNQSEVRSGEDKFFAYINGGDTSWYNLRLFPDSGNQPLDAAKVQRITVFPLPAEESDGGSSPLIITRNGGGWSIEGMADDSVDTQRVDSYVRSIIDAEGDTFIPNLNANEAGFDEGRIVLELGSGSSLTIRVGALPDKGRGAVVSGSPHVYSLAEWTVSRIFREPSYFTKD
jgi:hypothetical protein